MKKIISIFSFLIITLFLISEFSCLGVLPGRKIIDYSGSRVEEGSFKVINSENRTISLSINLNGDLEKSFEFSERNIILSPYEKKVISYIINLSENLSPGTHIQEIILSESKTVSENIIGAIVEVISQIYVQVPYPGKYVDSEFNIEGADSGQEVIFSLIVSNLGKEEINDFVANVTIFDAKKQKIETISLEVINVEPGDKKEVNTFWIADFAPGEYFAEAFIQYGSESTSLRKSFFVGEKFLNLSSVVVNKYSLGGIAKFEMNVENKWNGDIKNVYSQTSVFDSDRRLLADFRSPTYDLPSLSNQTFLSYWDTEGISEGVYDAVIYLRYGENFSKTNVKLDIGRTQLRTIGSGYVIFKEESLDSGSSLRVFFIVVLILIILNLLWFVIFRKKFKCAIH